MLPNKELLVEPASRLIKTDDVEDVAKKIAPLLPVANAGARFSGSLAVFNPLLELQAADPEAFRSVIRLVMRKRAERGSPYTPLRTLLQGETPEEKAAWQEASRDIALEANRNYVAETRARLRRMVKIENMLRPEGRKLVGKARLNYTARLWKQWAERRAALLQHEADVTGKRVPRERMREIIDQMWRDIDNEIDIAEARALAHRRYA